MTEADFWPCFAAPAPCSTAISACHQDCTAPATCNARWCFSIRAMRRRSAPPWDVVRSLGAATVLSPALGGIVIGQEVGRALGVRAIFAERQDGALTLRRGFTLEPGEKVLVVEDVVTTGGSTRETMDVARAAGAVVVGACAIVDRSGGKQALDVPFHALLSMVVPSYQPEIVRSASRACRS